MIFYVFVSFGDDIFSLEKAIGFGDNPCDHPHLEKVYYNGAFLINYACTLCGKDFTIAQKMEIDEMINREKSDNYKVQL